MQDPAASESSADLTPGTPQLLQESDSGKSDADRVTNIVAPRIGGTALAESTVQVYDGDVLLGSTVAGQDGFWSVTSPVLADGLHALTATATNADGNVSAASDVLALTIDTAAPAAPSGLDMRSLYDRGVSNSDNYTDMNRLAIDGYGEAGTTVTIYEGNIALGSAIVNAAGNWTVYTRALWVGEHHMTALATDTAGNVSALSAPLAVTTRAQVAVPGKPALAPESDTGRSALDNITNATTQKVVGTAQAGATVTLYDGSKLLGTQTADANGQWSFTTALAHGSHSLKATATDAEAFVSDYSSVLTVTVDLAAPSAPISSGIAPGGDSGTLANDQLTKVRTPTWTGNAEPNALVVLSDGVNMLGSAVANAAGAWSITSTALADGVHTLTVSASDQAGNVSPLHYLRPLTIDTVSASPSAPALTAESDDGVSHTDGISTVTMPTFTGTAETGSTVVLYEGETVLGSAVADGPSSGGVSAWSITVGSPLLPGQHLITAVSTDRAGNISPISAAATIDIRALAPLAPSAPDLAAGSDSGASDSDNITSATLPAFTGTAEAGAIITLYEGTTVRGSGVADGSGTWSITANAAFTQGLHTLTATAANGIGVSPASAEFAFTVDSTAPAAIPPLDLLAAHDSGASNSDNLTNVTTPAFSGNAEAGATVSLYSGATLVGSVIADSAGAWTIKPSFALADGLHGLAVKVTDVAGNASNLSTPLSVVVDTAAAIPSVPDLITKYDMGSSSTDNVTNITAPGFSGTAEAGTSVTLYSGTTMLGSAIASTAGAWTIISAPMSMGRHQITAVATDKAGNISAPSAALSVDITTVPPAPGLPDLIDSSDSGRLNSDNITNHKTPTFTGTAHSYSLVTLYIGGVTAGTAQTDASGMWTITSKQLASGTHQVMARANNGMGTSQNSPTMTLVIDTTVNAPANFDLAATSDTGVVSSDNLTSITNPVFTGLAESGSTVTLYEGGYAWGSAVADAVGRWSITANTMNDGVHSVNAIATDIAGNVSLPSVALAVTVDTAAPTSSGGLDLTSDSGPSNSDDLTNYITVVGSSEAGSRVTLYANGNPVATTTVGADGNWHIVQNAFNLPDGVHALTATYTDKAGNTSGMTPPLNITLDRTAPAKPVFNLTAASDSGTFDNDRVTNVDTPTFWGVTDAGATVTLRANGAFYTGATYVIPMGSVTADSNGYWEYTGTSFFDEVHTVTATVIDLAGNRSVEGNIQIRMDTNSPDIQVPSLYISESGGPGDFITNITAPVLQVGLAVDSQAVNEGTRVEVYEGDTLLGTSVSTAFGPNGDLMVLTTKTNLPTLDEGAHYLTLKSIDLAGNVGPIIHKMLIIDTVATGTTPDMLASSDTGHSTTDNITKTTRPSFTGTSEPGAVIRLFDGSTAVGVTTADSSGIWTLASAPLALGDHQIYATVTDVAGNQLTTGYIIVSVVATDTVAPSVLELDGGGIELLALSEARTTFDVDGDGVVVFDAPGDSIVELIGVAPI